MTSFVNTIQGFSHAEERPTGASRGTHDRDAALRSDGSDARQLPEPLERAPTADDPKGWWVRLRGPIGSLVLHLLPLLLLIDWPMSPPAEVTPAEKLLLPPVDPPLGFTGPSGVLPTAPASADFVPMEDRWRLGFPHARGDCRSAAGHCKCATLAAEPGGLRVLIGDGRSDFCAAAADLVIAKGALAIYCGNNRIPFEPFTDFSGAIKVLSRWLRAPAAMRSKETARAPTTA